MIRYDHYTDKFVKVSDREWPWCKAVCASTDKYSHECGWHIADTPQTEMDKCYKCKWWNYSYGCSNKKGICDFEQADTPQTDCDTCKHYKLACELFSEVCKYEPITQTETQNSNSSFEKQTDCAWK